MYKRRQADHRYADQRGVFYIEPGIGTTDVKKGLANFESINRDSAKQLDYYLQKWQGGKIISQNYDAKEHNRFKYGETER